MIVPMHKYSFVVHHRDFDGFLESLMDLGMVQVNVEQQSSDDISDELRQRIRRGELVRKRLEHRKVESHEGELDQWEEDELAPRIREVLEMEEELEACQHKKVLYRKEISDLEPWGDFSLESIRQLEGAAGLKFRFYSSPQRRFQRSWVEDQPAMIISEIGGKVNFVVVEMEEHIELPLVESSMPAESIRNIKRKLRKVINREKEINFKLDDYAANYMHWLEQRISLREDHLDFLSKHQSAQLMPETKVVTMEGWCPETRQLELDRFLDQAGVVYVKTAPEQGEKPPVMLHNNRFARLFEPIGKLFSLPDYAELDLTSLFAPFFLLFFGFCLGDAGYGIVMILLTTFLKFKAGKDLKPFLTLGQLFGASTIVFGILSGTFFGLELVKIDALARFRSIFLDQEKLLSLALIFGAIQIIFGISVRAYKQIKYRGLKYGISPIGWIILLLSLTDIAVIKGAPAISGITVWIGVGMVVLFGSPGKKLPVSIGMGLADLYNITGVVGDLMSYIRLFALGVSSAILGLVVNSIAQQALNVPVLGVVLFIFMLVVGHGGNLMLATLSAFVHPLRLTFVEFYKNAEFNGGGAEYKPFKKRVESAKINELNL